jgi:calcineurin-like phosphoesterase family protein
MNYFSGDWHLGHANILKYDKRDFKNIDEHDQHLIKMATTTLKHGDNLYYDGDWALCALPKAEGYMAALASTGANLFFIKGNHDKKDTIRLYQKYGTFLGEQKCVYIQHEGTEYPIVMNHFAMRVWDRSHHGVYHLYGHSHDGLDKNGEVWGRSMDCGIMTALRLKGSYSLFSFPDIHGILGKRPTKVIDHHGLKERGYTK